MTTVDIFNMIYALDVTPMKLSYFTYERDGQGKSSVKLHEISQKDFDAEISIRHSKIKTFFEVNDLKTLDHNSTNGYEMNLLMLAITYNLEFLFNSFLENKIYTPEQLRSMKNTMDYNLVTICRLFNRQKYIDRIHEYIKNY